MLCRTVSDLSYGPRKARNTVNNRDFTVNGFRASSRHEGRREVVVMKRVLAGAGGSAKRCNLGPNGDHARIDRCRGSILHEYTDHRSIPSTFSH